MVVTCALKNPILRSKSAADEKTKADLRDKNTNHIKDKNSLRRQLRDEREKIKRLMNRSITKQKKKEIVKEMLRHSIFIGTVSSYLLFSKGVSVFKLCVVFVMIHEI